MSNTEFETYLYISSEKFIILSKRNTDKDSFFKEKFIFDKLKKNLDLELLNQFLSENIFKIEKNINGFIKNINLIIEKNFLKIKISIKKDNYDKVIDKKILNYSLGDAKRQVKENYKNHEIIHLLVEKYFINDQTYDYFPLNKKADNLIIDLSFLCLSKKLIKDLEQILRNYQISINKIVSADYVENYFEYDNSDIFSNCQRIIEGINQNEVLLIAKNQKKLGFFERFFHLFS
tara:strand:- start:2583 stop:3281 length:699 start_codon:yes stop_codon:yes gene_type:complete